MRPEKITGKKPVKIGSKIFTDMTDLIRQYSKFFYMPNFLTEKFAGIVAKPVENRDLKNQKSG